MTSQHCTTSQDDTIETELEITPRVGEHVGRIVEARDDPSALQFGTAAVTVGLVLMRSRFWF
jgi:hypothetical protein